MHVIIITQKNEKGPFIGGMCATSNSPGRLANSIKASPSHVMIWSRCIAFNFEVRILFLFSCVRPQPVVYVVVSLPACVYLVWRSRVRVV